MLTEVYQGIFLNEVFLPDSPLKYLNSYIIMDKGRPLIVDTGFNRPECRENFFAGIEELKLDLTKCDVLSTHLHSDHCGLIGELQALGASILVGEREISSMRKLNDPKHADEINRWEQLFDLKKYDIKVTDHPGYHFRSRPFGDCRLLKNGDILKAGGYSLAVMDVPGHTKGHIALYEKEHKLFFGGDLILTKITPTVTFWGFEQDILAIYLDTLQKIRTLDIDVIFTGHRALIKDARQRIDELTGHHAKRLAEIRIILAAGEHSVSDTASKMTWDIRAKSWEDFPKAQKWFASGEAMSHLEHLYCTGELNRREENATVYYSLR